MNTSGQSIFIERDGGLVRSVLRQSFPVNGAGNLRSRLLRIIVWGKNPTSICRESDH